MQVTLLFSFRRILYTRWCCIEVAETGSPSGTSTSFCKTRLSPYGFITIPPNSVRSTGLWQLYSMLLRVVISLAIPWVTESWILVFQHSAKVHLLHLKCPFSITVTGWMFSTPEIGCGLQTFTRHLRIQYSSAALSWKGTVTLRQLQTVIDSSCDFDPFSVDCKIHWHNTYDRAYLVTIA